MKIWLINHYAVPTKYYPLARPANFAKYLIEAGHDVTIFAASTVHNSNTNLINDGSLYKEDYVDGIHYVYVKTSSYAGNSIARILNMFQYPLRLPKVCKRFEKPDAILATSVTPMACMCGIKLAKKYKCKCVAEIADLWPETFVSYGIISAKNILMKLLYSYERNLYTKAPKIIFTMEGGIDYIREKGWDKSHGGHIDEKKVFHINNGIDLEQYTECCGMNKLEDKDLDSPDTFKIMYTGAVRRVNGLGMLIDVAEKLQDIPKIKFIIYGDGDERAKLETICEEKALKNIVFKGSVNKKYIPYVLSKGDINLIHVTGTPIMRFGCSLNKLFDYFASGKPIISDLPVAYDLIEKYNAGKTLKTQTPEALAEAIKEFFNMPKQEYDKMCEGSKKAAKDYDFKNLTAKLMEIMEVTD